MCMLSANGFFRFQYEVNSLMLVTGATLTVLRVTLSTHIEEQW